jgi:cytochrome bd-type quinol oxidase subunit 2
MMMCKIILGGVVLVSFAGMVLSAMAASEAKKAELDKAKQYSTISAVLFGVSGVAVLFCLGMWLYGGGHHEMMHHY